MNVSRHRYQAEPLQGVKWIEEKTTEDGGIMLGQILARLSHTVSQSGFGEERIGSISGYQPPHPGRYNVRTFWEEDMDIPIYKMPLPQRVTAH